MASAPSFETRVMPPCAHPGLTGPIGISTTRFGISTNLGGHVALLSKVPIYIRMLIVLGDATKFSGLNILGYLTK